MAVQHHDWGIIGHEWAVSLLQGRQASGRLGHAYLFTGVAGVGKSTFALRLAQAMNCSAPDAPCRACRTCTLIERGIHPDVHQIEPEGTSIKIEVIRDLQQKLAMPPFEVRYRVVIINAFQKATPAAMDALLKTLEEPTPAARLLLTSDVAETLLPTIVSRCQVVPLRPVPAPQIEAWLAQHEGIDPVDAHLLAHLAQGRPGWALTVARDAEQMAARRAILDAIVAAVSANRTGRFSYAEAIAGSDSLTLILSLWQAWWRDVLLLAEGSAVAPVNADYTETLSGLAARITPEVARRALQAVRDTQDRLDRNANTRLAIEVMLLDMPYL
ncbi:MAG: DNA polymerase III subunit delta' [Anaerolineae bacterium]|nr:DNA polymerase III subunit delta' [Anaerolineae bacterium]